MPLLNCVCVSLLSMFAAVAFAAAFAEVLLCAALRLSSHQVDCFAILVLGSLALSSLVGNLPISDSLMLLGLVSSLLCSVWLSVRFSSLPSQLCSLTRGMGVTNPTIALISGSGVHPLAVEISFSFCSCDP